MHKKILPVALGAIALAVGTAGAAWATNGNHSSMGKRLLTTKLRGSNEVPAVTTSTKGWLYIRHDTKRDRMPFHLMVWKGQDVTMAHLHCAVAGQNGPVVVTLLGDTPGGFDYNGTVVKSAIEDDNIAAAGATCPTPITDVETLKTAIDNDQVYVNVHTVAHPAGEIRGQL